MKKVEKFSWIYHYGRWWIRFSYRNIFYRRTEVRGLEKFKPDEPIIFAPNHQNALMDALVFVTTIKQQPVFLSRADLFKNKRIARILNFLKMMPVYRIRDGFDTLGKNQEVFDRCSEILRTGHALCLFPEGNHNSQRWFRPLKKGLARIAFEAEDQSDFKLRLKIVPTGIDYSNYDNVRGRLTISYGEPITITDLKELYRSEPQKAMRELNNRIRKNIEPHMIEIPWLEVYDSIMALRLIYGPRYRQLLNLPSKTLFDKFEADKKMIRLLGEKREQDPDSMTCLNDQVNEYMGLLNKHNYRDHTVARAPYNPLKILWNTLWLGLGFPLHLFALITNYHLFRIPLYISRNLFKDPQFRATAAYVISMLVLMPISYFLMTLIIGLIFKSFWVWFPFLLSLLPAGVYMLHYMFENRKWRSKIRFTWFTSRKRPDELRLAKLRKDILEQMDHWVLPTLNT